MENKELVSATKITQSLIGYWLLLGIFFGLAYNTIYKIITPSVESIIVLALIAIGLQGIIALSMWIISTKTVFKNKTMSYDDVPIVMKNLIIFTVLVCALNGIYQFVRMNKAIDDALESDSELKARETMMSSIYDDDEMAEYNKQKEDAIAEAKSKVYTYLAILEIGLTAVYLVVLLPEKREILKYVS